MRRWLSAAAALTAILSASAGGSTAAPRVPEAAGYRNGLIAYTRCCGPAGIFVIRADGGGGRELYRPPADDAPLNPSWSPDGKSIAYAPGAPAGGIWVLDSAGRQRRRVTAGTGDSLQPSWSPDGRTLVFADLRARGSRVYDLFVVGLSGKGLKRLTRSAAGEGQPAWAPNGGEIVYDRGGDLWRMRTNGSGQRLLARNASSASWSPGGTSIAFVRGGDPWVMARDGSRAKRVADLPAGQYDVAWSPDSRWLVTAPVDRGDLLLVRADGSETRRLTRESGWFHGSPSWQRTRS